MKILSFTLLFVGSLFLGSPIVEWLGPKEHDFGDLKQGIPVEYIFKFKNVTDEPFVIDNIRTTCGCTAPEWSELPVEGKDSSEIKIIYDSRKTGYFRKKIKVFFSEQRKAEVLFIEGYVLAPENE